MQDAVSTLGVYEAALAARPISDRSLFGTAADGGAEAMALWKRLEREADMLPGDQSTR